jgi:CelD/BcsL family acetyltransferase involved in cellulose biosynthesis
MNTAIAETHQWGSATGDTLEACQNMHEAEEIWGAIEEQQRAWDFNATWMSFRCWVTNFSEGVAPVLKITAGGRPVGLFPAGITRRTAAGVSFRVLASLGNQHWWTGYPIIGSEPKQAVRALIFGLTRRRDWDVLEIGPMLSDCPLVRLLTSDGEEANLMPTTCHQEDDWRIRISGTWEDYYKGRGGNLRRTVARGERRLAALGEVTFEAWAGGPEFSERFAEFCQVEGSGWKGRAGTAICSDPLVLKFHEDLMRSAGERGQLRLFFLRLNGRAVACAENIIRDGVAYNIKIGRDETLAECGLGNITYKHMLEHLFRARDADTLDLMIAGGAHGGHKPRWGTEKREYVTLRFFNPKTIRGALSRGWFSTRLRMAAAKEKLLAARRAAAAGLGGVAND